MSNQNRSVRLALLVACCAGSAGVVGEASAQELVLSMHYSGVDAYLTDPRDAGLRDALKRLPEGVASLISDIPEAPPQLGTFVPIIFNACNGPFNMVMTFDDGNVAGGAWGYGIVMDMAVENAMAGVEIDSLIKEAVTQANPNLKIRPSTLHKGMTDLDIVFASCSYGAVQVGDDWRYRLILGTVDDADDALGLAAESKGDSVASFAAHPRHLRTLLDTFATIAGQQGDQARQFADLVTQLDEFGMFEEDAPAVTWSAVHQPDGSLLQRTTVKNLGPFLERMDVERAGINADHLGVIPTDASVASVATFDFSFLHDVVEQLEEQGVPAASVLEEFGDNTGVQPLELFDALGGTAIYYASDTTGGGGVFSTVALVELKDREAFLANFRRLAQIGNGMAEQIPQVGSRVRVVERDVAGAVLTSIRFPGLPVPVEITFATTDQWLILGLSPQGVIQAAGLAARSDSQLVSIDDLKMLAPGADQFDAVSGVDPVRMLRSGYPLTQMVGTAIGNLAMRPQSADGASEVIPPFNELASDPGLYIKMGYWSGDDYVSDTLSSGSVVVAGTIQMGHLMHYWPVIAPMISGAAAGAAAAQERMGWLPGESPAVWVGALLDAAEVRAAERR